MRGSRCSPRILKKCHWEADIYIQQRNLSCIKKSYHRMKPSSSGSGICKLEIEKMPDLGEECFPSGHDYSTLGHVGYSRDIFLYHPPAAHVILSECEATKWVSKQGACLSHSILSNYIATFFWILTLILTSTDWRCWPAERSIKLWMTSATILF